MGATHAPCQDDLNALLLEESGDTGVIVLHTLQFEDRCMLHLPVGRVSHQECLGAPEVRVHVSLQIGHCYDHGLSFGEVYSLLGGHGIAAATRTRAQANHRDGAAFDPHLFAEHKRLGDGAVRALRHPADGGARHTQLFARLGLGCVFEVEQTERFQFVERKAHPVDSFARRLDRSEYHGPGTMLEAAPFGWSSHCELLPGLFLHICAL